MASNATSYSQAASCRQTARPAPTTAGRQPKLANLAASSTRAYSSADPPQPHRKAEHEPKTGRQEACVYVLTLNTTPPLNEPLNALRDKHFPIHLNNTPAHLTLFHALPGSEMDGIVAALDEVRRNTRPFKIATGAPFRLKRGVGINVAQGSHAAQRVHGELQRAWKGFLSAQDARGWRPHWTIQNKVGDEVVAAKTLDEVQREFQGASGLAKGCTLWRYESGGRWKFERDFSFTAAGGERAPSK